MARTLNQVISELSPERRQRIERRYRELKQEVESLRELRETIETWVREQEIT